jgi:hypothetical protein
MPAKTPKQQRFMGMIAHNPGMAKSKGISLKVAKEFSHKPKGGYKLTKGNKRGK